MIRRILAIILTILILPPQQSAPACVVSGADVAAALAEAQTGNRCLELPAGVYSVAGQGVILSATADNLEIRGVGIGKTIIHVSDALTLTQDLIVFRFFGKSQRIHDLTIQIGTGYSGPWGIGGISVYTPAEHTIIEQVEIVGGYSFDGARGYGIGTYQPYDRPNGGANQYVTIRDCFIHDSPMTAIGVDSNANILAYNLIQRVGLNQYSHGFYAQGGNNLYEGNIVENASGYSFHGHKQVPSLDGSGDRYIGNVSVNPGTGGIVVNNVANGANPGLPTGAQLTRYATIQGNVFRNTAGKRSGGIWCNGVPCVIDGNTLEDTYTTTGAGWIEDSGGSVITGNVLTTLVPPDGATNYSMIRVTGTMGATVANNRLVNGRYGGGIVATGARHSITGNTILMTSSGSQGLILSGDALLVTGNRIESTAGAFVMVFNGTLTNLTMTGNYFKRNPTLGPLWNIALTGVTGSIGANVYDGALIWSGNSSGVLR